MLSWDDCVGLSSLTEEEIAAIAAHEHCPEMIAAGLGSFLVETADGRRRIRAMIRDDISQAGKRGDLYRAALLKLVLRHFVESHFDDNIATQTN